MIDLRSDTVTRPTPEMRRAMAEAEVGDDVYGEDPSVRQLEEIAAETMGKEAALFVASGTMGNQVALMAHTRRQDEVLLEAESHIFFYEAGGMAVLSGLMPFPIRTEDGILRPTDLERALRPSDIHFPKPSLVCLENTHNRHGGRVAGVEEIKKTCDFAHAHGLKVHLDGARIFNAAVALGVNVKSLVKDVDSVMFCLSKGLCAPVGSMLAGTRDFIEEARRCRKLLGGGMRQAGVLAAAGIVALKTMVDRLAED
ncbi:MAG TPA: low specificity L-threonine aldolase, partial [Clostridia bacterium]|nr:low specificity L-threonine aldolase [Clostridia bacterium]